MNEATTIETFNDKQLRAVLDNTVDGIVVINSQGIIMSFNHACEHLFGYAAQEVIGKNVQILMPPSYHPHHDNYIKNYLRTREAKVIGHGRDVVGARKDKTEFPMALSIGEVVEGNNHYFVGILRDITDQKNHESELKKYTRALEDSNTHLDDFVYIVSHDLKEPIRGINSYAQFLIEDHGDAMDEDMRSKLNSMLKMSRRMDELIDNLLHYSRLNRTELAYADLNLQSVVTDIIDMLEPLILEQKVNVHIATPLPTVKCDQARAGEVFRNLITNAMKYNDKPEKVVTIGATTTYAGREGQNVFYVKDNGIGIAENYYDAIFKMFKRLHARDAFGGGTGSGLAIVKKIISQHNGDIWLESQVGEGTTFYFTFDGKRVE